MKGNKMKWNSIKSNQASPSAPPGNIGNSRLKSIPPKVIASMNEENTRPVGRLSVPFTLIRDGTHMNTAVEKSNTGSPK